MLQILVVVISVFTISVTAQNDTFPPDFIFGVATAAFQIEGGWNASGKGPSIWDTYTHDYPYLIADHSNADVACDSFHKYNEDIELASDLGVNFYRFSISWPRILPYGYSNYINEDGIKYYNTIINELLERGIVPMVTMYHWDLPQELQNIGGWPNPLLGELFVDYAKVLFDRFGDRVKHWITFNEPKQTCEAGYGTIWSAPGNVNQSGIADYLCAHTIIKAHARVYHLYRDEFKSFQNGTVAITIDTTWYEPNSTKPSDVEAAFRKLMFNFGWFMNPIFYKTGDYPEVMKERVGVRSYLEGFPRSRLPVFTPEEIHYIKGSYDFLGLNIYTSAMVADEPPPPISDISFNADIGVREWQPSNWGNSSSPWLKVTPWGARKLLDFIKSYYGDFPIIITENGYADKGELQDYGRIDYYKEYLNAIYQAITIDKVNVIGYTAWSLIDNYEWIFGYTEKFGLNYVNFTDPNRARTPKNSARCYKKVIKTHTIDWSCTGDE